MAGTDPIVGKTILELDPVTGQIDRDKSYVEIHIEGETFSKKISMSVLALHGLSAKEVVQLTHPEIVTDEDFINFITGQSAFEVAKANGFPGTEQEWLASLKGANGLKGDDGVNGKSAFEVAQDQGFTGTVTEWLAGLHGLDGKDGTNGTNGTNGKSAYEVAQQEGFTGTPAEWLLSLVGPRGLKGEAGTNGTNGTNGVDGDSAYEVAVQAGFSGDVNAWLLSLKGAKGETGAKGEDGKSAPLGIAQGVLESPADLPPVEEFNNTDYFFIGKHCYMAINGEWIDLGDFSGAPGRDGSGITVLGELPSTAYLPETGERNGDGWLIGKSMWVWNGTRFQEQGQEGLQGPKGETGATGAEGKSSYDVVRQAYPEIDTMSKYVEFIRGLQGLKGDTAVSFVADGTYATVGEMPAQGIQNHGFLIGQPGLYDFHVWIDGAYVNLGNNVGPKGEQGDRGIQGQQGPTGRAMTPKGELANTGLLPMTGNVVGDYYSILFHFHAWDGVVWNDLGSFRGAQGAHGEKGDVGSPVNPKGELASEGDLPTSGNVQGDAYEIGGYIYVYGGTSFKRMGRWQGRDGTSGTNGKSAYQIAVDAGFPGSQQEWLDSLHGENGQVFDFIGNFATPAALNAAHPNPINGLAAITTDTTPYHIYLSDDAAWFDAGPVGVKGEQGLKGDTGTQGKSAYQVAQDEGFQGDVTQWLASLKGLKGDTGTNGTNGKSAYEVAQAEGFPGTPAQWLASLVGPKGNDGVKGDTGASGPPLNLKGTVANQAALPASPAELDVWITNDTGHAFARIAGAWSDLGVFRGSNGANGKSAYEVAVQQGYVGTENQWLLTLVGPKGNTGSAGTNGVSLTFIGDYANQAALPAGTVSQVATAAGRVYIHNGTVWVDTGAVGVKGDQGIQGKSAYEVAKDGGFVGTEAQWLTSLVGPTGATGKSTYQDAVDRGLFTGTFPEFLAAQKGATGASAREDAIANGVVPPGTSAAEFVQFITGPQGIDGPAGPTGNTGPAISIIGTLANQAALPATGVVGTGYAIPDPGQPTIYDCWIWVTNPNQWFNLGHVVGSQGPKGDPGIRGLQGLRGLAGDKGDPGTAWVVFPRDPQAQDGRIDDYFFNSATQEFFRKTSASVWASLGHIGGGNLNAPSSDGKYKAIKDGAWVDAPLLNSIAATGDKVRGVKNGVWLDLPLLNTIPTDPTGVYQLVNGVWTKMDIYTLAVVDVAIATNTGTVNWNTARQFRVQNNTAGAKTMNLTNIPAADRAATVVVKVYGKTAAFNWTLPSGSIRWFDGAAPTFTNDITTVVFNWDGTEMIGSVPN